MSDETQWWLGRGSAPAGPYAEAEILAWLADGRVTPDDLGWREGMPEWQPLRTLFPEAVSSAPPSPPAIAELPMPTGPHWLWLVLISIVTFGIAMWIWAFVQASWVRRLDPRSRASAWLIAAVCCIGVNFMLRIHLIAAHPSADSARTVWAASALVNIAELVFFYISAFSMSESMRRMLPKHGLRPKIGGVTLFFFSTFYLQAQMNWIGRALRGGSVQSDVSRLAVWAVGLPLAIIFSFLLMAARGMHGIQP